MLHYTKTKELLNQNPKKVVLFFIVFYLVGIVGMLLPFSFPLFLKLIPLALLLSSVAIAFFHTQFNVKSILLFSVIYLLGFFVEVAGVNTGVIFGPYHYGQSLGLKVFNTPLIIGLNWLLLVYISAALLEKAIMHKALKVVFASAILLGYDLIIEQIAPDLDMWYWHDDDVPLQNYLAWFLIAVVFHTLIKIFNIKTSNKLAVPILICQVVFFLSLLVSFKLRH